MRGCKGCAVAGGRTLCNLAAISGGRAAGKTGGAFCWPSLPGGGRGDQTERSSLPAAGAGHHMTTLHSRRTPRSQLHVTGGGGETLRWCRKCERHLLLSDFFESSLTCNQYECKSCVLRRTKQVRLCLLRRRPGAPRGASRMSVHQSNFPTPPLCVAIPRGTTAASKKSHAQATFGGVADQWGWHKI